MKVRLRNNGYRDWEVLEESDTFYIVESDYLPVALKKLECVPVQEWSHLYTFYANPKGPIFELRSKEGPEGSIIIEGKVK